MRRHDGEAVHCSNYPRILIPRVARIPKACPSCCRRRTAGYSRLDSVRRSSRARIRTRRDGRCGHSDQRWSHPRNLNALRRPCLMDVCQHRPNATRRYCPTVDRMRASDRCQSYAGAVN